MPEELEESVRHTCTDCNEPVGGEGTRCDDCADEYIECDLCDAESHRDNAVTLSYSARIWHRGGRRDVSILCESCAGDHATCCDDCGDTVPRDHATYISDDVVCDGCRDENYNYCDDCGEYRHHRNPCPCCQKSDLIQSYSYKPYARFHGTPKGLEGYVGVELEVNTSDLVEHAEAVIDQLGNDHVYLKEDGSIGEGFEVVTHPHTFAEQRKLWENWEAPSGMTSARSGKCGIHVHYSRAGLSDLHINRMVVFLNAPENLRFIECIAQRSNNNYCRVKSKCITSQRSYDRYEALNLCNDRTIEFRIFRGNTRKERILKCIEFAVATVNWTRDRSYRDLSYSNFIVYVQKNAKQYPHLNSFIKEKWTQCV